MAARVRATGDGDAESEAATDSASAPGGYRYCQWCYGYGNPQISVRPDGVERWTPRSRAEAQRLRDAGAQPGLCPDCAGRQRDGEAMPPKSRTRPEVRLQPPPPRPRRRRGPPSSES